MPRSLPWLVPAKASGHKRPRNASPNDDVDATNLKTTPVGRGLNSSRAKRSYQRTPSTSPPPGPPDVEFMQDGDDVYLMVEDEFLSVAKTFTQHIHHAEYVRLKKLARSRGSQTLAGLSRPVDGRTKQSAGVKLRAEARDRTIKQANELTDLNELPSGSEEDDEFMQDAQLAGLMTRPKVVSRDLSGFIKRTSHTRAAAGFSQSPRKASKKREGLVDEGAVASKTQDLNSTDDDDDDLDLPVQRLSDIQPSKSSSLGTAQKICSNKSTGNRNPKITTPGSPPAESSPRSHTLLERNTTADNKTALSASPDLLAKRRERRKKQAEEKAVSVNEIPTFIF